MLSYIVVGLVVADVSAWLLHHCLCAMVVHDAIHWPLSDEFYGSCVRYIEQSAFTTLQAGHGAGLNHVHGQNQGGRARWATA
jgi:hypothetical protein